MVGWSLGTVHRSTLRLAAAAGTVDLDPPVTLRYATHDIDTGLAVLLKAPERKTSWPRRKPAIVAYLAGQHPKLREHAAVLDHTSVLSTYGDDLPALDVVAWRVSVGACDVLHGNHLDQDLSGEEAGYAMCVSLEPAHGA